MRERALTQAGGRELGMRWGMRSWIEAGGREQAAPVAPTGQERTEPPPEDRWQQIAALWASVFVGQAERSQCGQRQA